MAHGMSTKAKVSPSKKQWKREAVVYASTECVSDQRLGFVDLWFGWQLEIPPATKLLWQVMELLLCQVCKT